MPGATSSGGGGDVALRAPRRRGRRQIIAAQRTADSETNGTACADTSQSTRAARRASFNQRAKAYHLRESVPRLLTISVCWWSGGYRPAG